MGNGFTVMKCHDAACLTFNSTVPFYSVSTGAVKGILGRDGRALFVLYTTDFNNQLFTLKAAHCVDIECRNVSINTVDGTNEVGWFPVPHIATDGNPLITYTTVLSGRIRVAHCNDPACARAANINEIYVPGGVQGLTSLIGLDGNLLLVYTSMENGDVFALHCKDLLCVITSSSLVGNAANATASVIVGPTGNPYILIPNSLIICGDLQCDTIMSTVPLPTLRMYYLTADITGNPVIFLSNWTTVNLVRCLAYDCVAKVTINNIAPLATDTGFLETVQTIGADGMPLITAITVDSQDIGATSSYISVTHCDNQFCTKWKNN